MSSNLETCAIATLVVIVLSATSLTMPLETENGDGIHNIVYLGTVDGKSFFYEKSLRNWTEAAKMCNEAGMRMATITSQAQATFLNNSKASLQGSAYWVAAQETQTLSRYAWSYDGEGLNLSPVQLDPTGLPPVKECLTYSITTHGQYSARECSVSNTFTLCEVPN